MTGNEITDTRQEVKQITRFTKAVVRDKSGNYPLLNRSKDGTVFPSAAGQTSNRGNKLFQSSENISRKRLNNLVELKGGQVYYNGSEHKLLSRKRMRFNPLNDENKEEREEGTEEEEEKEEKEEKEEEEEEEDSSDDDDLHRLVNVRKILAPIASLSDVVEHPAASRTFKSTVLKDLALQLVLMVEREQESVISYSRLLEVFLGDYPYALYEDTLQLESYDHSLRLPDDGQTRKEQPKVETDEDPFFALPKFNGAETLLSLLPQQSSETSEDIEATRQLAQIALQRNQEFIRNLQKIRNCVIKGNRIRERILMWAKEYTGIPEEDVTVPSALHVVKRGLISATTNRSMGGRQQENLEEEEE